MSGSEDTTPGAARPRHLEWIAGAVVVAAIIALVLLFRVGRTAEGKSMLAAGRVPSPRAVEEILAIMGPTKIMVSEYWVSQGVPPQDQQQAGLAAPEAYAGRYVQRMRVQPDGTIRIDFRDGDDSLHQVDLVPQYNASTGILLWDCRTSHPGIGARIEGCTLDRE
jgi:hypothetical protein